MMKKLQADIDYPRNEEGILFMLEATLSPTPPPSLSLKERLERGSEAYVATLRNWPQGFSCPLCQKPFSAGHRSRDRVACSNRQCAGHEETLTSGTLLHATKTKLFNWILAAWFVVQKGMPEDRKSLAGRIGISVKTATQVLRTLRKAMERANKRLNESDPTKVCTLVSLAEGDVHVVFSLCKALTEAPVSQFGDAVDRRVTHWVVAHTLDKKGTQTRLLATARAPGSLLRRWKTRLQRPDTPTSRAELQGFLEEFVFLENHRAERNRGQVFYELIQELVATSQASDKP